jgi:APA family basic amino acid/polyamine antiporter
LGGYVLSFLSAEQSALHVPLALVAVIILTLLVLTGIRLSSVANIVIVTVTLSSLALFVIAGLPTAWGKGTANLTPFFAPAKGQSPLAGFLEASALMFVAYTGYGRIATLGEEIREPHRNIPLAIVVTLVISLALYIAVGYVGVATVGAQTFAGAAAREAAPLQIVARQIAIAPVAYVVAVGAVTAMLGVLLNLILGLSRVVLAMARRRDVPRLLAEISEATATPYSAVIFVSLVIAGLALLGNVKTTWSFSAFSVLIYYAITNLAAIRLSDEERLYPRWIAWLGLTACLFLAFWIEWKIWLAGISLVAIGLVWHAFFQFLARRRPLGTAK